MTQLVVSGRAVAATSVVALVLIALAGFIGYNAGLSYGLRQAAPLPNLPEVNQQPTSAGGRANQGAGQEVPLTGEPVTVQNKTILNGTVGTVASDSFSFNVLRETLNTATRTVSQKTTTYQVKVTAQTKITEQVSTVTIPVGGGSPRVTTGTRQLRLDDLEPGQAATVTTTSQPTDQVLVALTVQVSTVLRK